MYSPTSSLTDPPAYSPIADGVGWVQGVALGSVAMSVAVVAVAAVGLLMLSGRLELRRGVTVVLGCVLLFGAGSIGGVITRPPKVGSQIAARSTPQGSDQALSQSADAQGAYDPYAGASVPRRR